MTFKATSYTRISCLLTFYWSNVSEVRKYPPSSGGFEIPLAIDIDRIDPITGRDSK